MKASTWKLLFRFVKVDGFFKRWFNREQPNKWKRLRARIEAKATKFVFEKLQKEKQLAEG